MTDRYAPGDGEEVDVMRTGRWRPAVVLYPTGPVYGSEPLYRVEDPRTGKRWTVALSRIRPRQRPRPTLPVHEERVINHGHVTSEVIAQPKPAPRWTSERYLKHVRAYPCCNCGAPPPSEAHHWEPGHGMSRKPDDVFCAPLCTGCHRAWHDKGALPLVPAVPHATRSPIMSKRIQVEAQRRCMADWIAGRKRNG